MATSKGVFFAALSVIFAVTATATIMWCASMPSSMVWMRMPGQTWLGAGMTFLGLWVIMMVAMMLPSLTPMLWRHHQSASRTTLVGAGYFFVWAMIGLAVYPIGVALAAARVAPSVVVAVVVLAVVFQCMTWKVRCRTFPADTDRPLRQGLRLGLDCAYCCAGLMTILLAVGIMDLRAMAVVTAGITVVRLAPRTRFRVSAFARSSRRA